MNRPSIPAAESARTLATFHPKLLDTLPGYTRALFLRDLGAGLTVGVVALPQAMAFAIASGLKPEAGLFTAIIAGFIISALGGSRPPYRLTLLAVFGLTVIVDLTVAVEAGGSTARCFSAPSS